LEFTMRTATLPAVRVTPATRALVESVLEPEETLSTFIESSIRERAIVRQSQKAFIERGLASAARVAAGLERTYSSEEVFERLRELTRRKQQAHQARQASISPIAPHG
jgi:hypothetical protein